MEPEQDLPLEQAPARPPSQPEADRYAALAVRRWLEDAWRHGEVVVDDDGEHVAEHVRQPGRFDIAATDASGEIM